MAEWSRIVNTTIHKYLREEEPILMRNRKVLALLQSKGRVSYNNSGDLVDWKIKYKRAPVQGYADSDTLTFSRRDRWKTAQLGWRGYVATDSMTKLEKLKNKNTEAIVNIYAQIAPQLVEDIDDQFGDEMYVDGNATGNSLRLHGIESMFGVSGASTKNPIGLPSDTYAGLLTDLGNYGGSWAANSGVSIWPNGTGDAHYDFWSPLIVDYTSTLTTASLTQVIGWAATTKTWPNTCREALRYGLIQGRRNKSKKGMIDLVLLHHEMYRLFEDKVDQNERLVVRRGDGEGLVSLGFNDVIKFDGVDISFEYGVPADTGYGWCVDDMDLMSLQGQLFVPEGPDFDIASQSYRFSIDFFGNLRFKSPRRHIKFKNIT